MLCIIIIASAVLLCLTFIIYLITFFSPHKNQNDIYNIPNSEQYLQQRTYMVSLIDDFVSKPYERVYTISRDGIKLSARYYHQSENAPVAICFHGYRGTAVRDFCGAIRMAISLGQNVLLVDQRGCGESGGHTISFGVKEQYDCMCWIEYARMRFGENTPITLYGVSMGAATVIAVSGLPLPKNIKGIVADCPYSSPAEIIKKVCRDLRLPAGLIYPFIRFAALLFGRFDPAKVSAVEAVKHSHVPILIIHGEDDRFVPCNMSRKIRDANPKMVSLNTFPDAGHGLSYIKDTKRYEALVKDFLEQIFPYEHS